MRHTISNAKKKLYIGITIGILLLILFALSAWRLVEYHNKTLAEAADEAASEAYAMGQADATNAAQLAEEQTLQEEGFFLLSDCMKASGYEATNAMKNAYQKSLGSITIDITFNFSEESATKNEFSFDLADMLYSLRGQTYIKATALSAITNDIYTIENGNISATRISDTFDYEGHEWTKEKLIAHAGGGFRDSEGGYFSYYTNSYEAMVQNYNLGNRIFEFDFALTTDNRLAAVHDWDDFANMDGQPVSSLEWEKMYAIAKPETEGTYTSIFLEDILDQMVVNQDMYLITDVKYENMTADEIKNEFTLIYNAALDRDPLLINRIVPQIYSMEMYDWIMEIYNFPSIIFTCYKTDASAEEIISFCAGKSNIHVITAKYEDSRFGEDAIEAIHQADLLIYNYTISTNTKMYDCFSRSIDGIYSNNMLPTDIATYLDCLAP